MARFYLKNTLCSPAMAVGILGLCLAMIVGTSFTSDVLYCYEYSISLGVTTFFIPVAAVLPICLLERQMGRGQIRHICLLRSGCRSFSTGAMVGAAVSGMAVMLGAYLLFTAFCWVYSPSPYLGEGLGGYSSAFQDMLTAHPLLHYLVCGFVFTINGTIWPAISLLCFSFTSNPYVALAAPFIFKNAVSYLTQPAGLYYLDTAQLLLRGVASQLPLGGIPYVLLYSAVVVLFCGIVHGCRVKREVRHG